MDIRVVSNIVTSILVMIAMISFFLYGTSQGPSISYEISPSIKLPRFIRDTCSMTYQELLSLDNGVKKIVCHQKEVKSDDTRLINVPSNQLDKWDKNMSKTSTKNNQIRAWNYYFEMRHNNNQVRKT